MPTFTVANTPDYDPAELAKANAIYGQTAPGILRTCTPMERPAVDEQLRDDILELVDARESIKSAVVLLRERWAASERDDDDDDPLVTDDDDEDECECDDEDDDEDDA